MSVTLDKEPIKKAVENSVGNFVHEQLNIITIEFQRIPKDISLNGQEIDDLRDIQCLIDEARKAEEDFKNVTDKIDKVLDKLTAAISKSQAFLKKYNNQDKLLGKVIYDLEEILNSCEKKLALFSKKLKFIKESLVPITKLENLEENSKKKLFEEWAEAFERFADGLEECLEIYEDFSFEIIENFAKGLLSLTSNKSYNNFRKDGYKRRLRFAATYVIKIITQKKLEIDFELENEEYTIVKDLRTLAHAQYKITQKQIMDEMKVKNIDALETEEEMLEAAVNLTR